MATPSAVKRAAAESERLIRELQSKPGEAAAPTPPPEQKTEAPTPPPEQKTEAPAPAPAPTAEVKPTPEPEPVEDWKQRYSVLRGKYDKEVPELKVAVSELQDRNRNLEKMLEQMAANTQETKSAPKSSKKLIKPEEEEEYGREFFDVVGRRAAEVYEAQIADLQEQIKRLAGQASNNEKLTAAQRKEAVFVALAEQVPNWESINGDQAFLAWLADRDVFSGRTKRELLSEAFENADAARVVRFFKAFQEDSPAPTPAARTPSVDAGTLVAPGTPRAGAPAEAPGGGRMWTQAQIAEFYSDVRRGKVPTERRAQIEAEIFAAVAEGRVR